MADIKKTVVELEKLALYDELIKQRMDNADSAITDKIGEVEQGSTVVAEIGKAEKAAKDYVDEKVGDLGSVLNFKGIVDTEADLPKEGMKQGDVYNVKTTSRGTSAEFVYVTNKGWEELGTTLDLSAYETATVTAGKIATAKSEAIQAAKDYSDGLDTAMDARVDALESAIGEGGSVESQITAAIEELDYTDTVEGDYVKSVSEEDGIISVVKGTFNFDEAGAAAAVQGNTTSTVKDVEDKIDGVQGNTTSTVKDVEDKIDAIQYASEADIRKLFATAAE